MAELVGMDVFSGDTFGFSNKRTLPVGNARMNRYYRDYDTRDGKNFVIIVPTEDSAPPAASAPAPPIRMQMNITLNWLEELKKLVPPR